MLSHSQIRNGMISFEAGEYNSQNWKFSLKKKKKTGRK